jgi:hypothetical protein
MNGSLGTRWVDRFPLNGSGKLIKRTREQKRGCSSTTSSGWEQPLFSLIRTIFEGDLVVRLVDRDRTFERNHVRGVARLQQGDFYPHGDMIAGILLNRLDFIESSLSLGYLTAREA